MGIQFKNIEQAVAQAEKKTNKPQKQKEKTQDITSIQNLPEDNFFSNNSTSTSLNNEQVKYNIHAQSILEDFHQQITVLPARQDLKKMLKKCIYGIFTNQKIDAEINFLCEVRQFLNKVRDEDVYYVELLSLLENIYFVAVDKQIQNQFLHQEMNVMMPVDPKILNLFIPILQNNEENNDQQQNDDENISNQQQLPILNENQVYVFQDNEVDEYVIDEDFENNNSGNNSFSSEQQQQLEDLDEENIDYIPDEELVQSNYIINEQQQYISQMQNRQTFNNSSSNNNNINNISNEIAIQNSNNINIQQANSSQIILNHIRNSNQQQSLDDKYNVGIIYEVDENLYASGDEH